MWSPAETVLPWAAGLVKWLDSWCRRLAHGGDARMSIGESHEVPGELTHLAMSLITILRSGCSKDDSKGLVVGPVNVLRPLHESGDGWSATSGALQ